MSSEAKVGYRGYSTHREFGGNKIPVPIQNLMMRDYTSRQGLMFKLGVDEFDFPNCYLRLRSILQELPTLEGIITSSLFILPEDRDLRLSVYEEILAHDATLHLIMENAILERSDDIDSLEEFFQLSNTLKQCPISVPEELLPELKGSTFFNCEER